MNAAIIDVVFILILVIFTLRCAIQGFVSEIMSIAALIAGMFAAIFFFRIGAQIIRIRFMPELIIIPEIIAFILIFLIAFGIVKLAETLLKNIIETIQFGAADRFLGFIFGFAEGVVVVCLALFVISIQPFFDPQFLLKNSFFADILLPFITGEKRVTLDMIARFGETLTYV